MRTESDSTFQPKILTLRGSIGGVGTSMISANLGIFLAQIGKQVLLVDFDLDSGYLYSWVSKVRPKHSIADILRGNLPSISDAITPTDITGLYIISGSPDLAGSSNTHSLQLEILLKGIQDSSFDFVIINLPVNFTEHTLRLFNNANLSIIVTLPLPNGVEATYRFLKAAWIRGLIEKINSSDILATQYLQSLLNATIDSPSPRSIIKELESKSETAAKIALDFCSSFQPCLVVNQIKLKDDEELGNAMVSASSRWLGIIPHFLGNIGWDENVWLSQRREKTLLVEFARSRVCKDLEQIVRQIMGLVKEPRPKLSIPPPTDEQNYYELLEIYPGASEEEVRRAHKQIKLWFGLEAMAIRGVCSNNEREHFELMVQAAHAGLIDRKERKSYDKKHFPEGFSKVRSSLYPLRNIAGEVFTPQESLEEVNIGEDTFVDGFFLGKIRKERNVDLIDISNRAKISIRYLKAIEEHKFKDLPAPVFTRGFVVEYAKFLKIDPKRAVTDFMFEYESYLHKQRK